MERLDGSRDLNHDEMTRHSVCAHVDTFRHSARICSRWILANK